MLTSIFQKNKNKGNIINFINKSIQKGANFINNKIHKNKQNEGEEKKVELVKEFEVISTDMKFEPRAELKQSEEEEFDDYNIYQTLTNKFSNELSQFKANSNEIDDDFEPKEHRRQKRPISESRISNEEEDFEELTDKNYIFSDEEWNQILKNYKK